MEPTEVINREITVVLLEETGGRDRVQCTSYPEAISTVKRELSAETVAKIENREGKIVFSSEEMDIEDWENEWKRAKRRLSVDVEEHDCPYDTVGCVADDHCVQCQMDIVQRSYRTSADDHQDLRS